MCSQQTVQQKTKKKREEQKKRSPTNLEDLQQIHLANDANNHQLEKLQLEQQVVSARKQYRALQHAPYGQMPWFSQPDTKQESQDLQRTLKPKARIRLS